MEIRNCTKVVLFFLLFISLSSCHKHKYNPNLTYADNHSFGFELPNQFYELPDTDSEARLVKKLNPDIIYLARTTRDSVNYLFSVSKYSYPSANPMEYVFYSMIKAIPTNYEKEEYKLVDFGVKKVNNKLLRVKISSYLNDFYNVRFYFMKDDYSKDLYEIKTACLGDDITQTCEFMEKTALSVQFGN